MSSDNTTRVDMSVSRYHTTSLSDAEARSILAASSELLTTADGADDVATPTDFRLQGSVTTFSVGDGSVDSKAEYLAVCSTGGRVHVVEDINWCSGPAAGAIGCSDRNGTCMIVMRDEDEAVLWAHEYGHNTGLPDTEITDNVMNGTIEGSNRKVTQSQSNSYRGVHGLGILVEEQIDVKQPDVPDIREFVRRRFIHGIPRSVVNKFPKDVVPILLDMLGDPKYTAYRANIVSILGMIGDERAVDPLLRTFAETGETLTAKTLKVRKMILMNFGYLLHRTKNREVLEFLLSGLDPNFWSGTSPLPSAKELNTGNTNTQLTKMAVWGLAISGLPDAETALRSLQASPLDTFSHEGRNLFSDLVDEALEVHSTVKDKR